MNFLDRFLMVIYTLGIMMLLFIAGLAALGWTTPVELLQLSLFYDRDRVIVGSIVVFYLLVSLKFFLQALSGERAPAQAVVRETEMGQIRISVEALENITFKAASQIKGVKDVKPKVACLPDGVKIMVRVVVMPQISVPQVSDEIQATVREYITDTVGIKVLCVKVLVNDISSDISKGMPRKLN